MAQQSYMERVADDVAAWLEEMPKILAERITINGRAPFSASVSEQQKLAYYRSVLFNPDGSPNQAGREATLQRVGIDGYLAILQALNKDQERMALEPPDVRLKASQAPGGEAKVQETLQEKY